MKFTKGLQGVIAAESYICHIDGEKGKLVYRGYKIEDLTENCSFEEVIFLLWHGNLPNRSELRNFKRNLSTNMKIPPGIKKLNVSKKVPLMTSLRTAVSMMASYDKDADDNSMEANKEKAIRIMAKMPSIVTAISRIRSGKKVLNPKSNLSFAANFLYMLNGRIPTKEEEETMNACLILHAEHGLNASTFASRVTVATLSDMYSGMVSAIGTLKGPLHGGANVRAIENLHKLVKDLHVKDYCEGKCLVDVDKYVYDSLKNHIRIMGIGHRVYKVKDPRAKILEKYTRKLPKKYVKYYQIAKEIENVMVKEKKLYPNVDFFSGMVYESIGIKTDLYVCLFALSRTSGWLAHMLEQYSDNRLIRPRALYKGAKNKKYIQISKR